VPVCGQKLILTAGETADALCAEEFIMKIKRYFLFGLTAVLLAVSASLTLGLAGCDLLSPDDEEEDGLKSGGGKTYTITLESGGGSAVAAITGDEGTAVAKPADPVKTGFTFTGWYSAANGGVLYTWPHTLAADVTMYAQWRDSSLPEPAACTVTFESGGGSAVAAITGDEGTAVAKPADPVKAGFAFTGWYSAASGGVLYSWPHTLAADVTMYAQWRDNSLPAYTVTFESNGGSKVEAQTVGSGGRVTEPEDPVKAGFLLDGWYMNEALSTPWNFLYNTVNKDMTLYAKWKPAYTVTFDSTGGSAVEAQTVGSGDRVTEPEDPVKAGFLFAGWYKEAALAIAWDFWYNTVAADTTLYARWQPAYTVTFESNGGSAVEAQTVAPGYRAAKPEDPAKAGSLFDGWYMNEVLSTAWNFNSDTVNKDMTLYAKWKPAYTVTFESNGGSEAEAQTVGPGDKVAKPVDPAKDGYLFDGWYKEAALTNIWDFSSDTVSADMTLYAKWKITYTVSFDSTGGSEAEAQTVGSGNKVTAPANPAKDGYLFDGWYKEAALTNIWDFSSDTVSAAVTLYAKWKIAYTVTFEGNNGGQAVTQTVGSGDRVIKPANPGRTGYFFDNWYKDAALDTPWDFPSDTVSTDITLYAKWWTQEYSVGDKGPGGGTIFYFNSGGFGPDNAWHYLEVANGYYTDWEWSTSSTVIETGTAIGTGKRNTELILASDPHAGAAFRCNTYSGPNDKSDWFLPSKDELNELYKVRSVVGAFSANDYWSSSSDSSGFAWIQEKNGSQYNYYKNHKASVYPVRAFNHSTP
jgi:uncharacterized repeat protein (TIGR02543 family)